MNIVKKAQLFAMVAHEATGQKRKYDNAPYFTHPFAVAKTVEGTEHGKSPSVVAAAYLHDVVEDTHIGLDIIEKTFGPKVAELVNWVTDKSTSEDGPRAVRKAIDRTNLAYAPPEAQTIKLADLIDNTSSIVEHDPEFAKIYLEEKRQLLRVMTGGDEGLRQIALKQIGEDQDGD